jgi:hypothetical protein
LDLAVSPKLAARAEFTELHFPWGKTNSLYLKNIDLINNIYRLVANVISEPVYVAYPFWIPLYTAVHTVSASTNCNLFI